MSYEQCEICGGCSPPMCLAIGSCGEQLATTRPESVTVTDEGDDEDCRFSVFMVPVCTTGFTS